MPRPNLKDPRDQFATLVLPWVLGAVMLVLYCATRNHWINLSNLMPVAIACGWQWQPQLTSPLTCLITLPFHWLNPASVPAAMNLFAAVCAALTLVLLARGVAILPQDRTEPQRQREKSDFSFLTGPFAVIPPIVAVLFLGLQLTFWKHATNFTGEMVDLLLFAIIVWLLLEYRLDERPWRMTTALVLYGACMAEDWMFIGAVPLLIIFLLWVKGLEFFNLRFLVNSVLCGLAGLCIIFILPLIAEFEPQSKITFWEALKVPLREAWTYLSLVQYSFWRKNLALAWLTTLLPALLIAVKWSANFGDNSRLGSALANTLVVFVSMIVMGVCAVAIFDPPFSAGQILPFPCLPLGFIAALCIGYFSGYFLLVFGKSPVPSRREPNPRPLLPKQLMWVCPIVIGGLLLVVTALLATLAYRNLPLIRAANSDLILKFTQTMIQEAPQGKTVLFADLDDPGQRPVRALLAQALLAREGRFHEVPVADSQSIALAGYHRLLHAEHPDTWPLVTGEPKYGVITFQDLFSLIKQLSASNTLCYLNPSYGYYFERFYQEPHGITYVMKARDTNNPIAPVVDRSLIASNETFWSKVIDEQGSAIRYALNPARSSGKFAPADWLLMHLHATVVADENALFVGAFYSRCLDDWAVRLERAGELQKAAERFTNAKEFNPDNVVADINLSFNETLQTNGPVAIDLNRATTDQFGQYRDWNSLLNANGPFDEVSFCYRTGWQFTEDLLTVQAAEQFNRVSQLLPQNLDARAKLAQDYVRLSLPDRALATLQPAVDDPGAFGLNAGNSTQFNVLLASIYFQKNDVAAASRVLDLEVSRHSDDDTLLTAVTQAYFMRNLYTNALRVIDKKLAKSPDNVTWLYSKGYASIEAGDFREGIAALTRVLQAQTNDPVARFNRAVAYLRDGQLDNARADYLAVQSSISNSYQIAFGLGQIAEQKHETNEAIRNYQIYVANAPTNTAEFVTIRDRLTQLRGH